MGSHFQPWKLDDDPLFLPIFYHEILRGWNHQPLDLFFLGGINMLYEISSSDHHMVFVGPWVPHTDSF